MNRTDRFPSTPPIIMTEQEVLDSLEQSLDIERDWLERQELKQPKTRATVEPRLLSTEQAAHYLGVSPWKLRAMVHVGEIEFVPGKYWRFDKQSLDRWITTQDGVPSVVRG